MKTLPKNFANGSIAMLLSSCLEVQSQHSTLDQVESRRDTVEASIVNPDAEAAETTELWLKIESQNMQVSEKAFKRAHRFVLENPKLVKNKDYLTLISFDQASTAERFYVINLNSGFVEKHLVAHGVNSGGNYATKFSNTNDSKKSSLGIYLTLEDYRGSNGRSLKLRGLESTNSNAEKRAIVIHGADYVTETFAKRHGRLGRSWGCPALNPRELNQILNKIQDGSVLYIFRYQDTNVAGR